MATSDKFCATYEELAKATGISAWTLKSMKAATRYSDDNPFCGVGAYPSDIRRWRRNHRDWQPSTAWESTRKRVARNSASQPPAPSLRVSVSGKSGARAGSSAPSTPSPVAQALPA